ncbi:MAG TPA: VacJ family lipoprotein [Gallionella sp.]|nr:VacJ family lipoprotein [Gallionella sp.]
MVSLAVALATVALTSGCATHANNPADPLESFNRGMYQVNDTLDKAIAKPVAQGYDAVMPLPGKIMVSNFFSNLDDILVTANDVLQLKLRQGFSDGMRVVVNSSIGVGGLFDFASMRLEKHNEDFGQTLGYWGVGPGPYIVLPILGPSTLRDGAGLYVDGQPSRLRRVSHIPTRNQLYATKLISRRAELLKQEKVLDEAVIDRYAYIRDAYLLRRQSLVYDGNPPRPEYDEYEEEDYIEPAKPAAPSSQQKRVPAVHSGLSVEIQQPVLIPLEHRASAETTQYR